MCSWEPSRARSCTWLGAKPEHPHMRTGWVMNEGIESSAAEEELEILVDEKLGIIL